MYSIYFLVLSSFLFVEFISFSKFLSVVIKLSGILISFIFISKSVLFVVDIKKSTLSL